MDAKQAKNLAGAFFKASLRCQEQRPLSPTSFEMLLVPAVVCAAFSVEVGMKALCLHAGAPIKGHDLSKLFRAVPQPSQDRIKQSVSTVAKDFDSELSAASNAFEEWRYVYEKSSANANVQFLNALAGAVQREVSSVIT